MTQEYKTQRTPAPTEQPMRYDGEQPQRADDTFGGSQGDGGLRRRVAEGECWTSTSYHPHSYPQDGSDVPRLYPHVGVQKAPHYHNRTAGSLRSHLGLGHYGFGWSECNGWGVGTVGRAWKTAAPSAGVSDDREKWYGAPGGWRRHHSGANATSGVSGDQWHVGDSQRGFNTARKWNDLLGDNRIMAGSCERKDSK